MSKLNQIQFLRGISAIFILLFHIQFLGIGEFAVDIFFCISGFIMMYSTEKNAQHIFLKRLIRIIPIYYFFTILMFILLKINPALSLMSSPKCEYLIKSLFFIPYISTGATTTGVYPLIGAAWTLNLEVYFYIIFSFSNKISHKKRGIIASFILILIFIIGLIVHHDIINYLMDSVILEFVFGIVSFYLFEKIKNKELNKKVKLMLLLITIISFLFLIIFNMYHIGNMRVIKYGILSFLIFNSILYSLSNVKIPKFFIVLGNISYSIYLVEFFVAAGFNQLFHFFIINSFLLKLFLLILSIFITIIISYVCWYIFENKLGGILKKEIDNFIKKSLNKI